MNKIIESEMIFELDYAKNAILDIVKFGADIENEVSF